MSDLRAWLRKNKLEQYADAFEANDIDLELGGLAEFERELIAARTGEGRECAKARGVKMGPKFKLNPHQQREAIKRRDTKGEPVREIARTFNVSHSTISRLKAG